VCKLSIKFTQQTQHTNYVTPKNFLDYILTYRTSLKTKRIQNFEQAKRLDGGLQKLIQAKVEVSTL
jgi:dynein heavy chain